MRLRRLTPNERLRSKEKRNRACWGSETWRHREPVSMYMNFEAVLVFMDRPGASCPADMVEEKSDGKT
jgi:hypothetical protein